MRTSPTKLLYLATAGVAVVMLMAGVSLWTVLTVVWVVYMVGMHLDGHGGGHGGDDTTGTSAGHAGHGAQADQPRDGGAPPRRG